MAQARGGTGFVQEQRIERRTLLGIQVEIQGLDGDQPRQQRIMGGVHGAQAPFADAVLERIPADVADGRHRIALLGVGVA